MPRQSRSSYSPAHYLSSRWRFGFLALLLLTTLAGCQLDPSAATLTVPATAATSPAPTQTATALASPAATTSPATASATSRPVPSAALQTATRAAATPGTPAPPGATNICVFAPPFGFATSSPSPAPTPAVSPRPTALGVPAPPGQTPPTIPLPNLAAYYALTVDQFDFSEGHLHTAETVQVTNREGCALDRLYFSITAARWGWFTLGGVRVGGQTVAATVEGTVLPVRLPQPLAAGATTEIAFDFQLDIGTAADPYTIGGFAGTTRAGDILRLAYWFPILSDNHQYPPFLDPPYTANADFTVTLTTPAELVVAPTGTVADQRQNADGTVTRRIEAANVRDFVLALSPDYQVARRQAANGVMVEVYYSPQTFGRNQQPEFIQQRIAQALDAAVTAEERLSALIGPYPYPTLRVVDGGATLSGGIEFPALVMIGLNVTSNNLVYHEVGHEWLYGLLGTRTQQDPWIDEGGATFLADYIGGTLAANPPAASAFTYRLSNSVWDIPPGGTQRNATNAIYTQGGAFYSRVMRAMGEDAFWGSMQALFRAKRYGIITPRDLLAAWQTASPVDLRPLFAEYLDYPWIGELAK
jgi:hypothetical protein